MIYSVEDMVKDGVLSQRSLSTRTVRVVCYYPGRSMRIQHAEGGSIGLLTSATVGDLATMIQSLLVDAITP